MGSCTSKNTSVNIFLGFLSACQTLQQNALYIPANLYLHVIMYLIDIHKAPCHIVACQSQKIPTQMLTEPGYLVFDLCCRYSFHSEPIIKLDFQLKYTPNPGQVGAQWKTRH